MQIFDFDIQDKFQLLHDGRRYFLFQCYKCFTQLLWDPKIFILHYCKKNSTKFQIWATLLLLPNEKLQPQGDGRRYYAKAMKFAQNHLYTPRQLFRTIAKKMKKVQIENNLMNNEQPIRWLNKLIVFRFYPSTKNSHPLSKYRGPMMGPL